MNDEATKFFIAITSAVAFGIWQNSVVAGVFMFAFFAVMEP